MERLTVLLFALIASVLTPCLAETVPHTASGGETAIETRSLEDYKQLLDLFNRLDYTEQQWLEGMREVPRVYLASIPERWSHTSQEQMQVKLKKKIFFRTLGPLILRSNEMILAERDRLLALADSSSALTPAQQTELAELARRYRVQWDPESPKAAVDELLLKVDTLPVSLILAQAAEESGWGSSRFAFAGNALFGQWTWGDDGITPAQQRSGKGDYKIARFDTPLQSVQAHGLNLNTHPAYESLRQLRQQKHQEGQALGGLEAATTLTRYSERGEAYVKTLQSIIRYNKLDGTDSAYLKEMTALVLIPKP